MYLNEVEVRGDGTEEFFFFPGPPHTRLCSGLMCWTLHSPTLCFNTHCQVFFCVCDEIIHISDCFYRPQKALRLL